VDALAEENPNVLHHFERFIVYELFELAIEVSGRRVKLFVDGVPLFIGKFIVKVVAASGPNCLFAVFLIFIAFAGSGCL
jgi:hypothetical protein